MLAVAGVLTSAASPALATSAGSQVVGHHHHPKRHHPKRHKPKPALKRVTVDGLVTAIHGRHVSVYATSARVGHHTTHDATFRFTLGRHVKHRQALHTGYVVQLVASGNGSGRGLVIRKIHKQHVAPSPATVIVGRVDRVSADELTVSQASRDGGGHARGGQRRPLSVDISQAKVEVDGAAGTVHAGDFVAILGEADGDSVLATRVYDISGEAESLRGQVVSVNADDVTVRSEGFNTTVALGAGDNEVPLFLDGESATADQLRAHDRIVVLGVVNEEEEGFTPLIAFGFDRNDRRPCGDNPLPRHHHH